MIPKKIQKAYGCSHRFFQPIFMDEANNRMEGPSIPSLIIEAVWVQ
ncbi:hypothetical protein [Catenisphaera adipataccumulans]|uniref:Uncharacterized protein n=1 Tax=Catenisphaera adipataccumulans TaxID=700500 RepID=A0A7W8FW54_9FIRM|nr:hypothetical protein [Catenisphaera adipataccumulans]MBB5183878.1 hypothetical protein [Catenisphaera adipataccumulans]